MIHPKRSQRKASALLAVVAVSAIILISVSTLIAYSGTQRDNITRMQIGMRETAAAERAVDSMVSRINYTGKYRPDGLTGSFQNFHAAVQNFGVPDDYIPGYDITQADVVSLTGDTPVFSQITDPGDAWFGSSVLRMDYEVTAQARETGGNADRLRHPGVQVARTVRVELIPIYQYAIFYENTLELDAGQRIDVVGKVHANGDFYLTTSSEAWYHKAITVAGHFFAGIYEPHTGRGNTNSTNINVTTNGSGSFDRVQGTEASPTQWLDNRYTNWVAEAWERFNGFLKDQALGVLPIGLPLPADANPHVIIETPSAGDTPSIASQKFGNIASITITGDPRTPATLAARGPTGNPIPMTYTKPSGVVVPWVTTSYLYNGREAKNVYVIDVNIGELRNAIAAGAVSLGNAVVYVDPTQPTGASANTQQTAARMSNANIVPTDSYGSFTFASSGPVYTKGNVNNPVSAASRALCLIAGDAINVLSNAFTDSQYQGIVPTPYPGLNGPNRTAAPTTTNAFFMGGNTPSDDPAYYGRYSGGAENYFRYLENWGAANIHTFNGTLMNLWKSQIANKSWDKNPTPGVQSAGYYSPPRRIWAWDVTFQNRIPPPHWPTIWIFSTINWELRAPE